VFMFGPARRPRAALALGAPVLDRNRRPGPGRGREARRLKKMVERIVKVVNDPGIHLRSASTFVKTAAHFKADVWVMKDGVEVNGKSILGVISLVAEYGSSITIRAKGTDEAEAVSTLATLVENRFYE